VPRRLPTVRPNPDRGHEEQTGHPGSTRALVDDELGVLAERRANAARILDQQLADSFDLQSQVKQAHWNVIVILVVTSSWPATSGCNAGIVRL
jgi:hypothetical protein